MDRWIRPGSRIRYPDQNASARREKQLASLPYFFAAGELGDSGNHEIIAAWCAFIALEMPASESAVARKY
jgi:hypothetical protein